ncbi:DUF397 domain-containing protein [Streptomyces violaceusniger]|uniref:DUF397 domain-containing protein n=1 Tax=Streptomyces violaceusniger (strain Tu 4113) TaxID=653045 RepID=G2PHI4_STRV4|nr:DUF397 domain-containing protein [Streptomyces violaceusniger]AEM88987.1 hypothetical protein Strvi_0214 [Streptomyces violaceusniger Tu 4113]
MNDSLFTNPIKDSTWTVACGGGKCCIEIAEVEGGGYALRNTQAPGSVIRCTTEELRTFHALIPGIIDEA